VEEICGGELVLWKASVILIRDLKTTYVILCGTGKQDRDSSVNIPTFQLIQGTEGLYPLPQALIILNIAGLIYGVPGM
jgi:multisubunit Na+/H+ antiporter MnhC subunit